MDTNRSSCFKYLFVTVKEILNTVFFFIDLLHLLVHLKNNYKQIERMPLYYMGERDRGSECDDDLCRVNTCHATCANDYIYYQVQNTDVIPGP